VEAKNGKCMASSRWHMSVVYDTSEASEIDDKIDGNKEREY
jgi:hypothetical protein